MLYLIIITFAIIVGLLRGGEIERLSNISIKGFYLFVFALILRGSLFFVGLLKISIFFEYANIILIISYLVLIYVSLKNLRLPGFKYITMGVLLNGFVIIVNGGKMPVIINKQIAQYADAVTNLSEQGKNLIYSINNSNALFVFLGDVLPLPSPFPESSILSVGDILIFAGLFILIQKAIIKEDTL